jgi:hypothetical protein
MKIFAFIDASNLFYGGEKSLGWKEVGKEIIVLARGPQTAREIRQFAGSNFRDFTRLESLLKFIEK